MTTATVTPTTDTDTDTDPVAADPRLREIQASLERALAGVQAGIVALGQERSRGVYTPEELGRREAELRRRRADAFKSAAAAISDVLAEARRGIAEEEGADPLDMLTTTQHETARAWAGFAREDAEALSLSDLARRLRVVDGKGERGLTAVYLRYAMRRVGQVRRRAAEASLARTPLPPEELEGLDDLAALVDELTGQILAGPRQRLAAARARIEAADLLQGRIGAIQWESKDWFARPAGQ